MTRKKGKQHVFKIYGAKSQRFVHRIEISKISSIAHKNDCKDKKKKRSNVMNCKKPNEKIQRYVIIFLGKVIYVRFYNWDKPLDLVLVMYDLIKLIIEVLF